MDANSVQAVLRDVEGVKRRARRDRRATSVPLLTFGWLTLLEAFLSAVADPYRSLYWLIAAPAGLAFVAWYYRRHEIDSGVGTRSSSYWHWALAVLAALVLLPFLIVLGAPLALVGIGLLSIAVRQRNMYLGAYAVVFAVVGMLESFYLVTNRLYDFSQWAGWYSDTSGYFPWAPSFVSALLGLIIVGAGAVAARREGRVE